MYNVYNVLLSGGLAYIFTDNRKSTNKRRVFVSKQYPQRPNPNKRTCDALTAWPRLRATFSKPLLLLLLLLLLLGVSFRNKLRVSQMLNYDPSGQPYVRSPTRSGGQNALWKTTPRGNPCNWVVCSSGLRSVSGITLLSCLSVSSLGFNLQKSFFV